MIKNTILSIIAAIVFIGCASTPVWLPAGVQTAACATVIAQPKSVDYLKLAGQVFQDLGKQPNLPSAKEMEAKLTTIPIGGLTEEQARFVWGSVISVWDALCESAKDQEKVTKLKATLTQIGRAIEAGATQCAPAPTLARGDDKPVDVSALAKEIEQALMTR